MASSSDTLTSLHSKLRSINKIQEYCNLAAYLYRDDFATVLNQSQYSCITEHYNKIKGVVIRQNRYVIKLRQKDDQLVMTTKIKLPKSMHIDRITNVDILNTYKILSTRGCDNLQTDYAKVNCLRMFKKTFDDYFQPENMFNILYLFIYLQCNAVLLGYREPLISKSTYTINSLPSQELLNDIYNLYNLLYVHISIIQ